MNAENAHSAEPKEAVIMNTYPEYRTRRITKLGHFGPWTKAVPFEYDLDALENAGSPGSTDLAVMLKAATKNVSADPTEGAGAEAVRIIIDYGAQQDEYTVRHAR
jgi:hypothetical protein